MGDEGNGLKGVKGFPLEAAIEAETVFGMTSEFQAQFQWYQKNLPCTKKPFP